jgi:hypothetical protein
MNNRQEFIEKLEKFKFENPQILYGGMTETDEIIISRPKGSSKKCENATISSTCSKGWDKEYDNSDYCNGTEDQECVEITNPIEATSVVNASA